MINFFNYILQLSIDINALLSYEISFISSADNILIFLKYIFQLSKF